MTKQQRITRAKQLDRNIRRTVADAEKAEQKLIRNIQAGTAEIYDEAVSKLKMLGVKVRKDKHGRIVSLEFGA